MSVTQIARPEAGTAKWTVDPARSTVEFTARHWWGLAPVSGRFTQFDGSYVEGANGPEIMLTIDASSVDTGNRMRDRHLRSGDYFDVAEHPEVRFASERVVRIGDDRLHLSGRLEVAGTSVPVAFEASLHEVGEELEIDGTTEVDQRRFGMSRGPFGNVRPPTHLHVTARLVADRD